MYSGPPAYLQEPGGDPYSLGVATRVSGLCSFAQPASCPVEAILKQQGDNKPLGKHWTTRFVKRHLELSAKRGKRQEAARFDGFTPKPVNLYFNIQETEYSWIKPENTVNVDEGGIMARFGKPSTTTLWVSIGYN
uniref:WGS project CBMG000000000 data, contig CS5907-c002137 n=1 Tax=Fusarium acuminatum CS5907 TaxID=1318461 RepID=A0A090N517_9HYPO|nr:unnamed protein product [Fusarium acuminatum CS5907]